MAKMKRSLLALLALLMLTSCGSAKVARSLVFDEKMPSSFLKNNAVAYKENRFNGYTKYNKIQHYDGFGNVSSLGYNGTYSTAYALRQTYVVFATVSGSSTLYGIYDLQANSEVLSARYSNIMLIEANYYNVNNDETVPYVFALLREDIVASGPYLHSLYNVTDKREVLNDYDDSPRPLYALDTVRNGFVTAEIITKRHSDIPYSTVKNNVSVHVDGYLERSEVVIDSSKVITPAKTYVNDSLSLSEYSYEFLQTKIIGYKNDNKVFEVAMPLVPLGTLVSTFVFDKYYVLQQSTPVASDAKDYTFFTESKKYLMTTTRIDLTTGKALNLKNFPYYINLNLTSGNVILQKDANNKKTLGILAISKVEDKILLTPNLVLFNNELKPLVNLTTLNYTATYYDLGDNKYLTSQAEIVDVDHKKVLDLSLYNSISFIPAHKLISLRYGGYYGLINSSGDILVPFEYNSPFVFYNGNAFNYNAKLETLEKISQTGTISSVGSNLDLVSGEVGLLYREVGNDISYYNFLEMPLFSITKTSVTSISSTVVYHQNGSRYGKLYTVYEYGTLSEIHFIY